MKYVLVTNPDPIVTTDTPFGKTEQKVVESPGRDILNYPIEEARLDGDGNIVPTVKPPFYEKTDRSLEWSIQKGTTLEMPEYVADVLKKRYDFLQVKEIKERKLEKTDEMENVPLEPINTSGVAMAPAEAESAQAKPADGTIKCKYCGQTFNTTKGFGLHLAHVHPDKIL